ncbi:MAG: hypothetical protein FJ112_06835 [Deltaproteobacteria bacterium]|nr:hypothetical protein [Deltaproteobacteria bacterium]
MYFLILIVALSGFVGFGESDNGATAQPPGPARAVPVVPPNPYAAPNQGFNRLNPNTIQVFDNDFFKPTPQGPQETASPKGRAFADDPQYNTDNRQKALEKCEPLKNQNYAKYQECYQKDLANVKKGIQESYDEVERKQSMPLRNTPNSLIEEQTRNPSGMDRED